jgi:hypothetical protein
MTVGNQRVDRPTCVKGIIPIIFVKEPKFFKKLGCVALDMLSALTLATLCYFLCLMIIADVWNLIVFDPFEGFRKSIGMSPVWILTERNTGAWFDVDNVHISKKDYVITALFSVQRIGSILFYSATALIPTFIYWAALLAALLSFVVVHSLRFLALQILALSIETEKSIFFYTSATVAIIVSSIDLITNIF